LKSAEQSVPTAESESHAAAARASSRTVLRQASALHGAGKFAEAEAMLREAIARDPGNAHLRNARGVMFAAVERHLDAMWCYRDAIAVVTWALVSEEVDRSLRQQAGSPPRLRPDQWKSGTIAWLIDVAGDAVGVRSALQWLAAGPFRQAPIHMIVRGKDGVAEETTLGALIARSPPYEGTNG
jgi:hypothetical protein